MRHECDMAKRDLTTRAGARKPKPRQFYDGVEEKIGVADKVDARQYRPRMVEVTGKNAGRPPVFEPSLKHELIAALAAHWRERGPAKGREPFPYDTQADNVVLGFLQTHGEAMREERDIKRYIACPARKLLREPNEN
jgi:hypothetical protein